MGKKTRKNSTSKGNSCSWRGRRGESPLERPLCDPWYLPHGAFPSRIDLVSASSSQDLLCGSEQIDAASAWVPPAFTVMELEIRRKELLVVPIDFMSPCGPSISWNAWVDKELQDNDFASNLRRAKIYHAVLLSRGSDMYCDILGLGQLVRRWNPTTHTFFLSWGEITVTLIDVERILLLPSLGEADPIAIRLTT
jgi:hypothetical protein